MTNVLNNDTYIYILATYTSGSFWGVTAHIDTPFALYASMK